MLAVCAHSRAPHGFGRTPTLSDGGLLQNGTPWAWASPVATAALWVWGLLHVQDRQVGQVCPAILLQPLEKKEWKEQLPLNVSLLCPPELAAPWPQG